MKAGELCNFLCSVKYWCFLLLLSLLSIDVPDIWFRWRECKSPTPKENGGKVIKWTFDAQQKGACEQWVTWLKTDWDFARKTGIATCPQQSSRGHGLKFTAWNACCAAPAWGWAATTFFKMRLLQRGMWTTTLLHPGLNVFCYVTDLWSNRGASFTYYLLSFQSGRFSSDES